MNKSNGCLSGALAMSGVACVAFGAMRLYGVVDVSGFGALWSVHPEDLLWLMFGIVPLALGVVLLCTGIKRLPRN